MGKLNESSERFIFFVVLSGEYRKDELLEAARAGNDEKLLSLLTSMNVNCHASDGRKVCDSLTKDNHSSSHLFLSVNSITSRRYVQALKRILQLFIRYIFSGI